jgi:quinol monooxygenase YgiN
MGYVVVASWRAREGEEDRVAEILRTLAPLCEAEPACRAFVPNRSREDRRSFLLYEQYDDLAGFEAHRETEHFKRYVLAEAVPLLEHRSRELYTTLETG